MAGASYFQRIAGHGQRGGLLTQPLQPLHPLLWRWETASTSLPPDSAAAVSGMAAVPAAAPLAAPQEAAPNRPTLSSLPASAPPDKTRATDNTETAMPLSNAVPVAPQSNAGAVQREPFSPADFTNAPANSELSVSRLKSSEVAALPEPVPAPSVPAETARTRTDSRMSRSRPAPAPTAERPSLLVSASTTADSEFAAQQSALPAQDLSPTTRLRPESAAAPEAEARFRQAAESLARNETRPESARPLPLTVARSETPPQSLQPLSALSPAAPSPLPAAPMQRAAGAERDRETTATPTPTVHIGSVEIRITPAPTPVPIIPPRPPAAPPVGSLARDFGSPLGLRQS